MKIGGHHVGIPTSSGDLGIGGGGLAGSLLRGGLVSMGNPLGAAYNYSREKGLDAKNAQDTATYNGQQLVEGEIGRRKKNVSDIRGMYGELDANQTPEQQQAALRMGGKLNTDINQNVQGATDLATQQNLQGAGANLTAVNANAAATGNMGSTLRKGQGAMMGQYLGNRANIAGGAEANRVGAKGALDTQKNSLVNSAMGGSLNIDPVLAGNQQAGAMNMARAQLPMNFVGGQVANLANVGVNSLLMNQMGYGTPNFLRQSGSGAPGSGSSSGAKNFVQGPTR